ncbi:MAG: GDSL-type esterase/lipase family protein [Verrucomicrobiales bacterium]
MRTRAFSVIALALLSGHTASAVAPGDNLLDDPGFEKGPWPQSAGWHGEITTVDEPVLSGSKAGRLVAGPEGEATIYSGYFPCTVGLDYRFTIQARGTGTLSLRSIQLRDHPEKKHIVERPENRMQLTDQWQELAIDVSPRDPLVTRIAVVVQLDGEGAEAILDDSLLTPKGVLGGRLTIDTPYAMVRAGESVEFGVNASSDEGAITEGTLVFTAALGDTVLREEVPIGGDTTSWTLTVPEDAPPGEAAVGIVNAAVGVGVNAWIDVVDGETYAQFEALARATRIETPAHLLFLGDSLTDQRRGYNYTDMVGFWLDRVHGDVGYRNAGVGGDYITRLYQRLRNQGAHRQEMYDDLFEPAPTRVFIWLGHNDSKLKPKPEYTKPEDYPFDPVVPLDEFEETFVSAIEHLRSNAPEAEFTVLSASSSVHEITYATVVKRIEASGNGGSYFGKPDVLEAFNERMQSVAERTGAEYLDVYEPTRTHPDKPTLFTADGVHMSQAGTRLVARLILEQLGE